MAATHPLPRGGADFMTQRRLLHSLKSQWFSNDTIEAECLVVDINYPMPTGNGCVKRGFFDVQKLQPVLSKKTAV